MELERSFKLWHRNAIGSDCARIKRRVGPCAILGLFSSLNILIFEKKPKNERFGSLFTEPNEFYFKTEQK